MENEEKVEVIEMSEISNLPFGITQEEFETQEELIDVNESEVDVNATNQNE